MNILDKIFIGLFFLVSITLNSQEIPPIKIFTPQDYGAEDQNWSISQSDQDFIFVANNLGLLEFNGATWQLYKSPNKDILRSVKCVGDRVYSGGYMDFGFWKKDQFGNAIYHSLSTNRDIKIKEDEEFWGIIDIEDFLIFQSFESIYIYNIAEDNFNVIHSDQRINKIFKVNESIYFQKSGIGLFEIENGRERAISLVREFRDSEIINLYEHKDGLLVQTKENGLFYYTLEGVKTWQIEVNDILTGLSIYSAKRLSDGSFVLGTISNGIIHLSPSGDVLMRIDQSFGLSNNTVLSIEEDQNGNLWLGLDNGINVLNLASPYRVYVDKQGVLGTIYCSAKTNQYLYLGTNQGLFYRPINSNSKFQFVPNTKGQVWTLSVIDGILFCGHDNGTFSVKGDVIKFLTYQKGTWVVKSINESLIIQGTYKGLSILEKNDLGEWNYRNKIDGFNISSRYLEFYKPHELLVSHEYKGVYKIVIDSGYRKIESLEKLDIEKSAKSGLVNYRDKVLYISNDGVFEYSNMVPGFVRDSLLSTVLSDQNYLSGKVVIDDFKNKMWGFTKDKVVFIEPGKLSNVPEINHIPFSSEIRKSKSGYENIVHVANNEYLLGSTDGYVIVDLDRLRQEPKTIYLNNAKYYSLHDDFIELSLDESSNPIELEFKNNNLKFQYGIIDFSELSMSEYQYRLDGIYDEWSDWSSKSEVIFENLPHGEYHLEVRGRTNGAITKNTLSYYFTINKPWFLSALAIFTYILLGIMLMFLIHYLNKTYYKRQRQALVDKKQRELELEQLESQKQIIQFKNENLKLDIENKNRELGAATMNLVNRNELLNNIKVELTKARSIDDTKNVIKLINSSLNNSNDWKLFEEAFNNVDKDFMKRVKVLHPSITPNDLRLCTYLRLNLSSKEIAPLLNISHKSVEVKRYRLRKKMGLDHEKSLTDYILDL